MLALCRHTQCKDAANGTITGGECREVTEKIIENAAWLFSFSLVTEKELFSYLHDIILNEDWESETGRELYYRYLMKISITARELAKKLTR